MAKLFITDDLPKPLSQEELEKLFIKYQEKGDESAKNTIIEHNLGLIRDKIIKKFFNTPYDKEDLFSIGIFGLIKAVEKYDYKLGNKFSTFAVPVIINEILVFMRNNKKYINNVDSIEKPIQINKKSGKEQTIEDILFNPDDNFEQEIITKLVDADIKKVIKEGILTLNDLETQVLKLRYNPQDKIVKSQKDVAEILNISQSYISRIEKRLLEKLKKYYVKNYENKYHPIIKINPLFDIKSIDENMNFDNLFKFLQMFPKHERENYIKYRGIDLENKCIYPTKEFEHVDSFIKYIDLIENDLKNMTEYYDILTKKRYLSKEDAYKKIEKIMIKRSIRFRFSKYTLTEINDAITKLPEKYQRIIWCRYGKDLFSYNEFFEDKKSLYNQDLKRAHKIIEDILEKRIQSLQDKYPQLSFEELNNYIKKLSLEDQEIIYKRNGQNLNNKFPFPNDKSYKKYYYRYIKAIDNLDCLINGITKTKKPKRKKSLITTYSKEELLYALPKLKKEDEELAYIVHGENLDQELELPKAPTDKCSRYYYKTYNQLFPKIDKILLNRKELRYLSERPLFKSLGDYTYNEIKSGLEALNEAERNVIIIKHGENLIDYKPWPSDQSFTYYKDLYKKAIYNLKNILMAKKYPEKYREIQEQVEKKERFKQMANYKNCLRLQKKEDFNENQSLKQANCQKFIETRTKLEQLRLQQYMADLYDKYIKIYGQFIDQKTMKNIIESAFNSYSFYENLNLEISVKFKIENIIFLNLANQYRNDPDSENSLNILIKLSEIYSPKLKERYTDTREEFTYPYSYISKEEIIEGVPNKVDSIISKYIERTLEEYTGEQPFYLNLSLNLRKLK